MLLKTISSSIKNYVVRCEMSKKNKKKLKNTEYFVSIDWLQFSFHELDITEVLSILHGIGLGAPSKWGYVVKIVLNNMKYSIK